jgi:aryl-alcohol dehydrogenase-like predicted oxidoreductase
MNPTRRDFLALSAFSMSFAAFGGMAGARGPAPRRDEGDAGKGGGSPALPRKKLGKTDMEVSVLGFGGAEIGYGRTEQAIVEQLLNGALDAGLNAIDTAECYALSEEQIGNAVAKRRKDYYLFTKVGHWPDDGWTRDGVARSIERSLERLKTDYVDVVHLHSCGKDVLEKGEVIEALEKAKQDGKTRYIGYSGDSQAARYAVETGRFDTLMTSISIADQEALDLTLPLAREKELGVIVKRGIANAVWRYEAEPENGYHQEYWRRMRTLDFEFCRGDRRLDEGPDGAAGIALRFVLGLDGVHTNVVGTTKPERYAKNVELLAAGPLPKEQIAAIRARWKEVAKPEWVGQI